MSFKELLIAAKTEPKAQMEVIELYQPLITKLSVVSDKFDEDLYQDLILAAIKCNKNFKI